MHLQIWCSKTMLPWESYHNYLLDLPNVVCFFKNWKGKLNTTLNDLPRDHSASFQRWKVKKIQLLRADAAPTLAAHAAQRRLRPDSSPSLGRISATIWAEIFPLKPNHRALISFTSRCAPSERVPIAANVKFSAECADAHPVDGGLHSTGPGGRSVGIWNRVGSS